MLDAAARRIIDPPLNLIAAQVTKTGVSANAITLAGLVLGISSALAVALGAMPWALGLLLASRFLDGLDGAVARTREATTYGGYLDIVSDFIVWALLPVAFAIANPTYALPAAILLASFMGASITFLAHAILASKEGHHTDAQGSKSFYYLSGLTEGTETIGLFVLAMLFPAWFPVLAYVFAAMATITTVTRMIMTWQTYGRAGG